MASDKKREQVKRAISSHQRWVEQWAKQSLAFSVVMVSPRGKSMTHSAYCHEVSKHLNKTVSKIEKILFDEV